MIIIGSNESLSSTDDHPSVEPTVVLFFDVVTNSKDLAMITRQPGVNGLILAKNPDDIMAQTPPAYPFAVVDYELGSQILEYIRTTRYTIMSSSLVVVYIHLH